VTLAAFAVTISRSLSLRSFRTTFTPSSSNSGCSIGFENVSAPDLDNLERSSQEFGSILLNHVRLDLEVPGNAGEVTGTGCGSGESAGVITVGWAAPSVD